MTESTADGNQSSRKAWWRRLAPTAGTMVAFSLLLAATTIRIADPGWLQTARVLTFDLYQRLSPRPITESPVIVVDIDEKSLAALGQWPWPRSLIGDLIDRLGANGVKVVGFDSFFPEYDRMSPAIVAETLESLDAEARKSLQALPSNESVMAEAMRKTKTVVGQVALHTPLPENRQATRIKSPFRAELGGDPRPFLARYRSLVANVPELEEAAAGHGFFSIGAESDGKVRRVPLLAIAGKDIRPALTVEMLRAVFGNNTLISRRNAAGMTAVQIQIRREFGGGSFILPTDGQGRIWVHFAKPDAYNTAGNTGRLYISASDILTGQVPKARLDGKFAIVGASAAGLVDIRETPVANRMPGVEVHANLLESIFTAETAYTLAVQERVKTLSAEGVDGPTAMRQAIADVDKASFFLRYPNYANSAEMFMAILAGIILMILVPRLGPLWTLLGLLIAGGTLAGISWYLYKSHLLLFDVTYPGATVVALYAVLTFSNYARETAEKRRVRSAFGQYLSPALVEQLAEHPEQLTLGGETKSMTILFCDVQGFTSISETYKADPQGLTVLINRLLTPLSDAILSRNGTIDKYMGDCIMAFWNAPMSVPDHEVQACNSALAMLNELDTLNVARRAEAEEAGVDYQPLAVGIGLNTGDCVVGNMGSAQRFDYSVLGDAVNLSARLEGQSREYGMSIVIGEETAAKTSDDFALLELDRIAVKGKTEAVTIYGLLGDKAVRNSEEFQTLSRTNSAMLDAYRAQKWDTADRLADECTALNETNTEFYALYKSRIAAYRQDPPAADWDGVFIATTK